MVEGILAGGDKEAAEKIAPLLAEIKALAESELLPETEAKFKSSSFVFLSEHQPKKPQEVPKEVSQHPLDDEAKADLIENILQAAKVVSGAEFKAIENDNCRSCSLRSCCPLMNEGEQVL